MFHDTKGIVEDLHATANDIARQMEEIAYSVTGHDEDMQRAVADALLVSLANIASMRRRADDLLVADSEGAQVRQ